MEAIAVSNWKRSASEIGKAVYRLTTGPGHHKLNYYLDCPWSPDQKFLVYTEYKKENPRGKVCLSEWETGETRFLADAAWDAHQGTQPVWQPADSGYPIMYTDRDDQGRKMIVSIDLEGDVLATYTGPFNHPRVTHDGRYAISGTRKTENRDDYGVARIDLQSGEVETIVSMTQILEPMAFDGEVLNCRPWTSQVIPHPKTDRIQFALLISPSDEDLKPFIKKIFTCNPDGSNLIHLGNYGHHPSWHPSEEKVLIYVRDFNALMRYGTYLADGSQPLQYIHEFPNYHHGGHPSFGPPDGRFICTDRGWTEGDIRIQVVLIQELATGKEWTAAKFIRGDRHYRNDLHPVWSPDGKWIFFNCDVDGTNQLYVIDVEGAISKG